MKNTILGLGLAVMAVVTILVLFTVYGQNTRQNELDESLSTAVEQSIENLKIDKHYDIADADELIADLNQNLVLSLESDSVVTVSVLKVDVEKGLIDVEVVETFKQPNKTTGKAVCRKTIVIDEFQKNPDTYHFVTFYTQDGEYHYSEYLKYSVATGSDVIPPVGIPRAKGYEFKGWSKTKHDKDPDEGKSHALDYQYNADDGTYTLLNSETGIEEEGLKMIVSNSMDFYAVFEKIPEETTEATE